MKNELSSINLWYFQHIGIVTRLRRAVNDETPPITAGLEHGKWQLDHKDIRLGKTLGSGQFGIVQAGVYKVKHLEEDVCCSLLVNLLLLTLYYCQDTTQVAVKMMKEGTMSEDDFIAEAQVGDCVTSAIPLRFRILNLSGPKHKRS